MTVRTDALALVATLCALACAPPETPRPPIPDASYDANLDAPHLVFEAGPRRDAALDAPSTDGPRLDAPGADSSGSDAGPSLVTVDGTLAEDAWMDAVATTTDVVTGAPFAACALSELSVLPTEAALFVGVRGHLDSSCNAAIVVYLDVDPAVGSGLVLDGTGGADTTSALHRVLSGPLTGLASGLQPDFGWGTRTTPLARSVGIGDSGWREVGVTPFRTPGTGQVTVCTTNECETSITYAALGLGAGAHRVALFARLGDGTLWADPALPPETPSDYVITSLAVDVVAP